MAPEASPDPRPPAPPPEPRRAEARPDRPRSGGPPLTLGDALRQALAADPQLKVSLLGPAIARAGLRGAQARWDPTLTASVDYDDNRNPAASALDGARRRETERQRASVGLRQPLTRGGSVEASITQQRFETNSNFALLNPQHNAGVSVTLRRPLAQGRRTDASRRDLSLADRTLAESQWDLRQAILDTLRAAEVGFWDLAAARQQRDVARLSLEQAETLLASTRARSRAGVISGVDVVEAEAAVAARRSELISADRQVGDASDALLRVVDPPPRPGTRAPPLDGDPREAWAPLPPVDLLIERALQQSPELKKLYLALEREQISLRFARDGTLPRLDLVTTMAANGLDAGTGRAFEQTLEADFPNWFVGLSFELPLGRRAARAEVQRRGLLVAQRLRQAKAAEVSLEGRIHSRVRQHLADRALIPAAAAQVEAALRKLDAEQARYREGLLPADDLLRFQRELAQARAAEVRARTSAARSALEVWYLTGDLPARRGVQLDQLGLTAPDGP